MNGRGPGAGPGLAQLWHQEPDHRRAAAAGRRPCGRPAIHTFCSCTLWRSPTFPSCNHWQALRCQGLQEAAYGVTDYKQTITPHLDRFSPLTAHQFLPSALKNFAHR